MKSWISQSALALLLLTQLIAMPACSQPKDKTTTDATQAASASEAQKDLSGLHKAYFASGCFWCVEAVFESVEGVEEAVSGYSGGTEANPTYRQVSSGATSHAEAVLVYYDSTIVDFPTLVKVYYGSHDPTTANRQGPDRGPQYRSIAFYENDTEKKIIEDYIQSLYESGEYAQGEIVTEVTKFDKFWEAEDYHQDYERNNPDNPYIRSVSIPRLKKFQAKYPELLKGSH
ncbi:MAG: peptide-methionine (S)-S-oxide reductase MsrA [Bacteroidia bacterium]|nr:peptide-methionine (S)-S-oxide reductase MsrA [Bacteroidia bacterium]